jgi:hypothetical protein
VPVAGRVATLRSSHAVGVTPEQQRAHEDALLAAAARGEARLHVSTLDGDLLALGAFHREPRADAARRWRRASGGRALATGDGFRIVTLALPHRAALVAATRTELRPEQVLNRCVRGVLAALRRAGAGALYPGLDLVTVGGRGIAQLGLREEPQGATLFQAVIAWSASFARTAERLDRADPGGVVPMALAAEDVFTHVHALSGSASSLDDVAGFAAMVGESYSATFDVAVSADPSLLALTVESTDAKRGPAFGVEPPAGAGEATVAGAIGLVTAWVTRGTGPIEAAGLSGDFIAPPGLPTALGERLGGAPPTQEGIARALTGWLDGDDRYVLGIRESALVLLLATAAARALEDRTR